MALMKMGRRGDPPTKKKKESTASVNKKEDEKVQLEGVTTSNIFYADIKDPVERVKAAQKYENDNYNKALKSGNTVTMSSIKTSNPKAYNLLSNSMQPNKDSYGEIEDFAVDKKYANVSSYEELGFPKGYSPEDRKKAIKADKLEEFEKKFGGKSQTSSDPNFGYYTKYKTDEKLKEKFDLDPGKLPIKSASMPTKGGSIIERKTTEKDKPEDWSIKKPSRFSGTSITRTAPSLNRREAVRGVDNKGKSTDVKFGGGANVVVSGVNRGYFGIKKLGYAAVANPLQKVRFNKEVRQGKAYFGSNEGDSSADLATKRSSLKTDKKDLKSGIREIRKGTAMSSTLTNSERIKGYRAEIGNINKDIKTNLQAGRYLKDLRGKGDYQAGTNVNEKSTNGRGIGKVQYATPEKFKGYLDSPQNKRVDKLADLKLKPSTIKAQPKIGRKSNNKLKN